MLDASGRVAPALTGRIAGSYDGCACSVGQFIPLPSSGELNLLSSHRPRHGPTVRSSLATIQDMGNSSTTRSREPAQELAFVRPPNWERGRGRATRAQDGRSEEGERKEEVMRIGEGCEKCREGGRGHFERTTQRQDRFLSERDLAERLCDYMGDPGGW